MDPVPLASEVLEKYQMAHVAEMMNWVAPMMKFRIHKKPKSE